MLMLTFNLSSAGVFDSGGPLVSAFSISSLNRRTFYMRGTELTSKT